MGTEVRKTLSKLGQADPPLSTEPTPTGVLARASEGAACTTQAGLALLAETQVPGFLFLRADVARCSGQTSARRENWTPSWTQTAQSTKPLDCTVHEAICFTRSCGHRCKFAGTPSCAHVQPCKGCANICVCTCPCLQTHCPATTCMQAPALPSATPSCQNSWLQGC